jgi:hypothetical protein
MWDLYYPNFYNFLKRDSLLSCCSSHHAKIFFSYSQKHVHKRLKTKAYLRTGWSVIRTEIVRFLEEYVTIPVENLIKGLFLCYYLQSTAA